MRQVADGELRQNTPGACGETQTEINLAPEAFNMNKTNALCLPVLAESQKVMWVYSDEVCLQPDSAAELDKAFDRFPYLTQKETAALAQRCSLHPGQVKAWFMVQRLRYGISWDYEDIQEVERKFGPSQEKSRGKEELQNRTGEEVKEGKREKKKQKRRIKESGGKKAGKVREEESGNEGRMMGENVRTSEQLERKVKQEQPMNKERDGKVETIGEVRNGQKKRKRMAVADKMGKRRMKQGDGGIVERAEEEGIRGDQVEREELTLSTREQAREGANRRLTSVQEGPADKSVVVPHQLVLQSPPLSDNQTEPPKRADVALPTTPSVGMAPVQSSSEGKVETETWLERELHAGLTNHSVSISGVSKLKELMEVNASPVLDGSFPFAPQQHPHGTDARSLPARTRSSTKTHSQLTMMKMAFCRTQYPSRDDYGRLATLIGVPRNELVQWFGDMRYYVKRGKPRWMNQAQHGQALANIRYRQCLHTLAKALPGEGGETAAWNGKVERSESFGMDDGGEVPLEWK